MGGGAKRMEGGKRTGESALPKILDPSKIKELLVCTIVDFCTQKTEQQHPRGVENVPYEGGSKNKTFFIIRGVIREVFLPPLFFHPPHGVLWYSVFCDNLRSPAVWCVLHMLEFPHEGAMIHKHQRLSAKSVCLTLGSVSLILKRTLSLCV